MVWIIFKFVFDTWRAEIVINMTIIILFVAYFVSLILKMAYTIFSLLYLLG